MEDRARARADADLQREVNLAWMDVFKSGSASGVGQAVVSALGKKADGGAGSIAAGAISGAMAGVNLTSNLTTSIGELPKDC